MKHITRSPPDCQRWIVMSVVTGFNFRLESEIKIKSIHRNWKAREHITAGKMFLSADWSESDCADYRKKVLLLFRI